MTTEPHLIVALTHNPAEPLTVAQKEALQRAVTKIVALGAQVGVNSEQMTLLLESGLTVGELLEYLAARSGEVA
jgi:ABC-type cobalamin transport system ATPase subunit